MGAQESPEGIQRFLDSVMGTSGMANIAGFADNANHFLEIPSRHLVWRRATANWVAKLVVEGRIKFGDGVTMMHHLAYDSVKSTYRI